MDGWLPWLLGIVIVVLAVGGAATRRPGRDAGRPAAPPRDTRRSRPGRRGHPGKAAGPAARPKPAARGPSPTRGGREVRGGRQAPGGQTTDGRPRAGEIWWADVPYEDGTGSKVRPCLVLRTRRGVADVLKITSQDKSDRTDHVRLPTWSWDPRARRDSFLDLTDPIRVAAAAFTRRAGTCDATVWRAVRTLHGVRTDRNR